MEKNKLSCFKAYDIRGRVPDELNVSLAYQVGRAFVAAFSAKKIVVGYDIRLSSLQIADALMDGICDAGADVVMIGLCGTEEVYHAVFSLEATGVDGGIMITASHNPADYNGMKFVSKGARPVSGETGLQHMADLIRADDLPERHSKRGQVTRMTDKGDYIKHLLGYIRKEDLKPLKIVMNSGNGCVGPVLDLLESELPVEMIKMHHQPDGTFPNGVPNPLLPEQRQETSRMVQETGADLGIGWDGDFDRCFFWDEKGNFIEGYYIVALLATEILATEPGGTILYDPRLIWNTQELVEQAGGKPIMTRTGHSFIKERMRQEDAVYGGEMSAHHYFRDFGYCDSGMIPWLLVCSLLSRRSVTLSECVGSMRQSFPVSGEINSTVDDPDMVIRQLEKEYGQGEKDYTDGLSVSFDDFRFNIRKSNTEPLLRLNVESRADPELLEEKTKELLAIIRQTTMTINGHNEA